MPCTVKIDLSGFASKDPRRKQISVCGVVLEHDKTVIVADYVAKEVVDMKIGKVLKGTPEKLPRERQNRLSPVDLIKRRENVLANLPEFTDKHKEVLALTGEELFKRLTELDDIAPFAAVVLLYKGEKEAAIKLIEANINDTV